MPKRSVKLTDPRALRAMAHPTRLALVGLLRRSGPLTATQAGERLGESPSSCSFHLRQLAKYGLVEEAGGGQGRERPWQATAQFTEWPSVAKDPEQAEASGLLSRVIAQYYFEQLGRWLASREQEPAEWQQASALGDNLLYLNADELAGLTRGIEALCEPFASRTRDQAARPPGARAVSVINLAFPLEAPE